jgi:hypothetical protein
MVLFLLLLCKLSFFFFLNSLIEEICDLNLKISLGHVFLYLKLQAFGQLLL